MDFLRKSDICPFSRNIRAERAHHTLIRLRGSTEFMLVVQAGSDGWLVGNSHLIRWREGQLLCCPSPSQRP